jgi:hypothetical protein
MTGFLGRVARLLADTEGRLAEARREALRAAVAQAASRGDAAELRSLLGSGGDAGTAFAAARAGSPEAVAVLLADGVAFDVADGLGRTPLHHLVDEHMRTDGKAGLLAAMAHALVDAGSDPHARDRHGESASARLLEIADRCTRADRGALRAAGAREPAPAPAP